MKPVHSFKYLYISLIVFVLDQITKFAVRYYMPNMEIPVIGEFFKLTHVQNSGAAFSMAFIFDLSLPYFSLISSDVILTIFSIMGLPLFFLHLENCYKMNFTIPQRETQAQACSLYQSVCNKPILAVLATGIQLYHHVRVSEYMVR